MGGLNKGWLTDLNDLCRLCVFLIGENDITSDSEITAVIKQHYDIDYEVDYEYSKELCRKCMSVVHNILVHKTRVRSGQDWLKEMLRLSEKAISFKMEQEGPTKSKRKRIEEIAKFQEEQKKTLAMQVVSSTSTPSPDGTIPEVDKSYRY
ncbi:uncharacterized protein LOC129566736 isoform X2 [Sitodiplosis mosellana]|uniref:uncharacterized protein LOC129566736 isoform X2 n=1 Tax=Sitodiplosis mosellana TaxID=263140 RepID=UPI002444B646|nr:uncharacterized protein LOC129566736 isoform X2 [Sitodiplosis mosellana]